MVTSKTLKYSHKKTCTGELEANKPKPIPKPKTITKQAPVIQDIEEVPPPKLVRTVTQQPTPEMVRTYRNQMRTQQLKMRSDRMSSMFANSI